MNKWRKRAQGYRRTIDTLCYQLNDLAEREVAALNKAEELRQDNIRLATELARVQGVCDATVVQVQKHAATIIGLRERENVALKESEALLAWQRWVREALPVNGIVYTRIPVTHTGEGEKRIDFLREDWDALRRAIEGEPKEET